MLQLRRQTQCCVGIVMALMNSTRLVPSRASSVHPMLRLGRRRASSFFALLRLRRRAASGVRLHNACWQAMEPLVGGAPGSVDLLGLVHRPRVRPAVVYNRAAPVHGDHGHGARSSHSKLRREFSVTWGGKRGTILDNSQNRRQTGTVLQKHRG